MAARDLASLERAKSWLNVTDNNSDAEIARLITGASEYLITLVNREILKATYTNKLSGNNRPRIRTKEWPILTVAEVKIGTSSGYTIIPASADGLKDGYVFDDQHIYLLSGAPVSVFTAGMMNLSITYDAGYVKVPPQLEQIVIEMVGKHFKDRGRIGLVSEGIAGQATSFSQKDISDDARMILQTYKRIVPA